MRSIRGSSGPSELPREQEACNSGLGSATNPRWIDSASAYLQGNDEGTSSPGHWCAHQEVPLHQVCRFGLHLHYTTNFAYRLQPYFTTRFGPLSLAGMCGSCPLTAGQSIIRSPQRPSCQALLTWTSLQPQLGVLRFGTPAETQQLIRREIVPGHNSLAMTAQHTLWHS